MKQLTLTPFIINEHGSAVILKERISLANDKYAILESENTQLKAKVSILETENAALKLDNKECQKQRRALEEKLSHISTSQEYVEGSGALFKKLPDGSWDYTPYCPACKTAMVQPKRHELYVCGKKSCGQRASFSSVNNAVSRLPNV